MNPTSSPSPSEQRCPNCGTMAPLDTALCPRCGMQLSAPSKAIYGCATLLFQGFLGLLALAFGASGACFALVGAASSWRGSDLWLIGIALGLLTVCWICIRAIIHIGKSRK